MSKNTLFNPAALRNLSFAKRTTEKRKQFRVTLNPQTISWLREHVHLGPGSGYGSTVIELSLRLLLSLLTADPTSMIIMSRDLKQALSKEGHKKLVDNLWILTASLNKEEVDQSMIDAMLIATGLVVVGETKLSDQEE